MRSSNVMNRFWNGARLLTQGVATLTESRTPAGRAGATDEESRRSGHSGGTLGRRLPAESPEPIERESGGIRWGAAAGAPGEWAPARRTRPGRHRIGAAVVALALALPAAAAATPAIGVGLPDDCDDAIAAANLLSDAGDYAGALGAFDAIVGECDGKSERIAIQAGRARALNMLKRYPEALTAADAVLADDDEHLFGLFERAYANEHTGNMDAATADYERIIQLTEKNQNVKERATIYAKVADLNYKSGKTAEAETYLAKAMELDPANPDFVILKGDWALKAGDYAGADAAYNQATAMGVSGVEMYQIRAEGSLKMVQDKYGTTNAQELRAQMTPQEKALVCGDLNRALALGWENPRMDMFAALTCQ